MVGRIPRYWSVGIEGSLGSSKSIPRGKISFSGGENAMADPASDVSDFKCMRFPGLGGLLNGDYRGMFGEVGLETTAFTLWKNRIGIESDNLEGASHAHLCRGGTSQVYA